MPSSTDTKCTARKLLERLSTPGASVDKLLVYKDIDAFLADPPACDAEKAVLVKALKECQQLAIDRIRTVDEAVKKDVYAADALMGIATLSRRALANTSPAAAALLAQGKATLAALQKYSTHSSGCLAKGWKRGDNEYRCNCGLDVALDAALAPGEET
jgi:hypothetical protein